MFQNIFFKSIQKIKCSENFEIINTLNTVGIPCKIHSLGMFHTRADIKTYDISIGTISNKMNMFIYIY